MLRCSQGGHWGAIVPSKSPRLAEDQRLNRIEKLELNDICAQKARFWLLMHPKCIVVGAAQLTVLPKLPSQWGGARCPLPKNNIDQELADAAM